MDRSKCSHPVNFDTDIFTCTVIHGYMCLGIRHPQTLGPSRVIAESFIETLEKAFLDTGFLTPAELAEMHQVEQANTSILRGVSDAPVKGAADLVERYVGHLHTSTEREESSTPIGDVYIITTPFLDRHNDNIQIFAEELDGRGMMRLWDGKGAISDLRKSGLDLDNPFIREKLSAIVNGLGVCLVDDVLEVTATPGDVAPKMHALIQAIIGVSYLHLLAR